MDYLAFGFSDGVGSRSTPGTSQEAHPPTPPLTPPLTPPEGTQTKPQVVVGRWLPPYGQEAPL